MQWRRRRRLVMIVNWTSVPIGSWTWPGHFRGDGSLRRQSFGDGFWVVVELELLARVEAQAGLGKGH